MRLLALLLGVLHHRSAKLLWIGLETRHKTAMCGRYTLRVLAAGDTGIRSARDITGKTHLIADLALGLWHIEAVRVDC